MKTIKIKPFKLKNIFTDEQKKLPPDYVVIDGYRYERIEGKTIQVDLDLDSTTEEIINNTFKGGGFVNRSEVVRDVLRDALRRAMQNEISKK